MVKFVVTGTTGGLGSHVFKHLLKLVPASDLIVSFYNPAGPSPAALASGATFRHGDFAAPATLDAAFAGADALLLVSYPSIAHAVRVERHRAAIDAAVRVRTVKRIYYTSLAFAGDSAAAVMRAHSETEAHLKRCGVPWTIVKEGIYSESFPLYFGLWDAAAAAAASVDAGAVEEVVVPHSDGGIAWASREDLGEGTARVMGGYENETILLSGSRAITLSEIAEKASALLGRTIKLRVVSEDEYVRRNIGKGGPRGEEEFLRRWATTYVAMAKGELAVVDPLLQKVLGRDLKRFDETLKETLFKEASSEVMTQYAK
ncbi:NmrA-like family protein [Epithele typhae]|uniref:NmrA-like family protein n=1 Tax=Epithele typhae TaxID=378194 RepID=UPI0020077BBD|nr:NmrA-like family protein [Epithele typhae]KAH9935131.1 NmrA-like family protein [Epithele typhae]